MYKLVWFECSVFRNNQTDLITSLKEEKMKAYEELMEYIWNERENTRDFDSKDEKIINL